MSDALNYLVKARPEALGHYLKFLKEAGRGLDPKTRDLISVITKVYAQTERGLRQYLTRAVRNGCTAGEILDALLMAFPALGLAKIVWAVDVILAMDLPEFRLDAMGIAPAWHDIMAVDALAHGAATRVECDDGRAVFVYRDGEGFRVYDSRCPHQTTNIPHLALDGLRLTCPKHQWAFDIRTGACVANGTEPLRLREAKIENGRLLAFW
jgi:nitrite reductase/ring-hydroxylating ferredoxin subunit/alkylhydroperoxidase/carboxymuconolactone decarboxylase family protein YurZ